MLDVALIGASLAALYLLISAVLAERRRNAPRLAGFTIVADPPSRKDPS